jgi:hypothetical protein
MRDWKIFHGNQKPHEGIQQLLKVEAPTTDDEGYYPRSH